MIYELTYNGVQYPLNVDRCEAIFNDEETPVNGMSLDLINQWLSAYPEPLFDLEYYEDDCESCPPKPRGKKN